MKDEILKVIESVFPGHQVSFIDNYDDVYDGWELNPNHKVHMLVLFEHKTSGDWPLWVQVESREIVGRYDLSINRRVHFRGPLDQNETLTMILENWRHIG